MSSSRDRMTRPPDGEAGHDAPPPEAMSLGTGREGGGPTMGRTPRHVRHQERQQQGAPPVEGGHASYPPIFHTLTTAGGPGVSASASR